MIFAGQVTDGHANMALLIESCFYNCLLFPFDLQSLVGKEYNIIIILPNFASKCV